MATDLTRLATNVAYRLVLDKIADLRENTIFVDAFCEENNLDGLPEDAANKVEEVMLSVMYHLEGYCEEGIYDFSEEPIEEK